jgi:hypothetical protein
MSQADSQKITFGETTYEMFQLPPMESHDLLMDLTKMVGPAVGPLMDSLVSILSGSGVEAILDLDLGAACFSQSTHSLFHELDKQVLRNTIKAFSKVTLVSGKGKLVDIFDAHFLGGLDEMYRWLAWGMRVQWGKSVRALVNGMKDRSARLKPPTEPSPQV